MRDKYTYEQIKQAAQMMLSEKPHYSNPQICKEAGITISRISRWRRGWNSLSFVLEPQQHNNPTFLCLRIQANGVCEDVKNDWTKGIIDNWDRLIGTTNPNEIQRTLEEIAVIVNDKHPEKRGISDDIIYDTVPILIIEATKVAQANKEEEQRENQPNESGNQEA